MKTPDLRFLTRAVLRYPTLMSWTQDLPQSSQRQQEQAEQP